MHRRVTPLLRAMTGLVVLLGASGVLLWLLPSASNAEELVEHGTTTFRLDLQEGVPQAVRWACPDLLAPGPRGFGPRDGEAGAPHRWILQTHAIGLGRSWRAPYAVSIRATARWSLPEDAAARITGPLLVRHGLDRHYWTAWEALTPLGSETDGAVHRFEGAIRVADTATAAYARMLVARRAEGAAWPGDEAAALAAFVTRDPTILSRWHPRIGYVQFQYEPVVPVGGRLEGVEIEIDWALRGPDLPPDDPALREGRDGPWRFERSRPADVAEYDAAVHAIRQVVVKAILAEGAAQPSEWKAGVSRVVVEEHRPSRPSRESGVDPWDKRHLELYRIAVDPTLFEARGRPSSPPWRRDLDLGVPYGLWSSEERRQWRARYPRAPWDVFHEAYPDSCGVVWVGTVAFSRNHEQALVSAGRTWDRRAGYGRLFVLERTDDGWIIRHVIPTWRS